MSIIIDDENTCSVCGAYWQGNGYCCNGHPRAKQMKEDKPELNTMDEVKIKAYLNSIQLHEVISTYIIELGVTKEDVMALVDAKYDSIYSELNVKEVKIPKKKAKKKSSKKKTSKKKNSKKKKVVKKQ